MAYSWRRLEPTFDSRSAAAAVSVELLRQRYGEPVWTVVDSYRSLRGQIFTERFSCASTSHVKLKAQGPIVARQDILYGPRKIKEEFNFLVTKSMFQSTYGPENTSTTKYFVMMTYQ